jgi:hypothetical protein
MQGDSAAPMVPSSSRAPAKSARPNIAGVERCRRFPAKHYRLMRSHPGLNMFTDAKITTILNAQ